MGNKNAIDLSIIIPTLDRSTHVDDLLNSVLNMDKCGWNIEIIIVDQNNSNLIDSNVEKYREFFNITHLKVNFKGLSKAKNFGASKALGSWICFPDDDCEFLVNTLFNVNEEIIQSNPDVLFGRCIDRAGKDSVKVFSKVDKLLNINNFEDSFIEATTFIKLKVLRQFYYDENMGVGALFGSEEGYDWIYRILMCNEYKVIYSTKIIFYHPQVILDKGSLSALKRVYNYRLGTAFLCVKHNFFKKLISRIFLCICGTIFFALILKKDKSIFYLLEFLSLISGTILAKKTLNEIKN